MSDRGKTEKYDLRDGDYLVLGKGAITVNGKAAENGTVLSEPGIYEIRVTGEGAYSRRVELCRERDAAGSGRVRREDYSLTCQEGVMPIAGFYGPHRSVDKRRDRAYDYITEDIYRKAEEIGINLLLYCDGGKGEDNQDIKDNLALASRHGIGFYVHDGWIKEAGSQEARLARLADYAEYEAFRGVAIMDEPYTAYYDGAYPRAGEDPKVLYSQYQTYPERRVESYGEVSSFLNRFANLNGNINLLPMIKDLGGEEYQANYERYLEEYITLCRPKVLSFDYYVFAGGYADRHGKEGYFANMAIARKLALKYGIAFWNFIQAGSNWNDLAQDMTPTVNDTPSLGQLSWNVNTSLAYGAKGIEYFTLIQPYFFAYAENGGYDYRRNGLIGADGEPNSWYFHAKAVNAQIQAVDEYLLKAVSRDVLAAGRNARKWTGVENDACSEAGIRSLSGSSEEDGVIVGVFDCENQKMLYIVNNDMCREQSVEAAFEAVVDYREISAGHEVQGQGQVYRTTLEPGAAVLLTYGFDR